MDIATRTDERLGIREEAAFFGSRRDKIFGTLHAPLTAPVGAVLICPSIHSELLANYRKEVLLARALASSGVAVQRFHYRGTGNSDGQADDITFESMVEDVAETMDRLGSQVDAPLGVMATRFGALLAAPAVSATRAAVVLWEPVLEPESFFKEVFRARMIRDIGQGRGDGRSRRDAFTKMQEDGVVDILGYPITRQLYDSVAGHGLKEGLKGEPRDILIVQITRSEEVKPAFARLRDRLEGNGCSVDIQIVAGQPAWWFVGERLRSSEDVDLTRDWFLEHLRRGSA